MQRKFESIDIRVLSCFDDCICQKIVCRISMKFVERRKIVFYVFFSFFFFFYIQWNFEKILLDVISEGNEITVKFI